MEIFLSIIKFLIEIIQKTTDISKDLPAFKIRGMYLPGTKSNPLIFLCNVTNKSQRTYIINEALIMKLNDKEQYPLVAFKASMLTSPSKGGKVRENFSNWENAVRFMSEIPKWEEIDELVLKSKETQLVAFLYQMSEEQFKHWSNFETRMVNPGMVLEDKILPAWFESNYQWSLLLKDENNGYWEIASENDYLSPEVDYPVFQEKHRLMTPFQHKIGLGILSYSEIVRIKWRHSHYSIRYFIKKLLYKLKLVKSL